jgi:hypothetical protein
MRKIYTLAMFPLAACSNVEPANDPPGGGKNDSAMFEGQILMTEFQESELHSSQRGASAFSPICRFLRVTPRPATASW